MKTILNIIWLLFGGFWLWLQYVLVGILACVLIITIPWGVACFRMANYTLWPFGREAVEIDNGAASTIANIIWFVVFGWILAIGHLITAFSQAITIIGIPLAVANLKLIPISVFPYGKAIVPTESV